MKHRAPSANALIRDLIGDRFADDGPPTKGNAAPAGNRDGAKWDGIGNAKKYSEKREEIQAVLDEFVGSSDPSDSPLDVVLKMTSFDDVLGYEAKPLALSARDFYDELPHWTGRTKESLSLIVGGEFDDERSSKGSLRHSANRRNVTAIVVDYDDERIPFREAKRRIEEEGIAAVGYTSPSHTDSKPRHRWVFPLSRPHSTADLAALTDRANGFFDGTLAGESWSPVQPFYVGQVIGRPPMKRALVDGGFLDLRDDLPSIPSKHGTTTRRRDKAEDPREKSGVVGAWCRVYDVPEAIDEFLSKVYVPEGRGRYRYAKGSSKVGGVAIYDDGQFAYSNHDSDPARGLRNSFDLVRIHEFGDLDAKIDPDTPVTVRPSYRAMCEFAKSFEEVAEELEAEDDARLDALLHEFDDETPEPDDDDFLFADRWTVGRADHYVVKRLIGEGDLGVIFGAPGSGKSVLAPYLARQVARGESAFGLRTQEARVLYVSGEDGPGIIGRFLGLGRQENIGIATRLTDLNPGSRDLAKLRKMVATYKPGIVFVDTLAACFPGLEENSSEGMSKVVVAMRTLTKLGAAVCLIHHSTKESNGTPRGHSLLNGALDFSLEVLPKSDDGVIRAVMRKNRSGPCDLDIAFKIVAEDMGEDADGDRITVPVCQPLDGPAPKAGPKPTPSEKAALDVLRQMDNGALGVDETEWRRACQRDRILCASDDSESRRKAAYRAIQGLVRKRLVRLHNEHVWISSPNRGVTVDEFDDESGDDWISRML